MLVPFEDKEGSVLRSKQPWTLQSWRRWKTGFQNAEKDENLKQETRQLAKKSAILMDALEATMHAASPSQEVSETLD